MDIAQILLVVIDVQDSKTDGSVSRDSVDMLVEHVHALYPATRWTCFSQETISVKDNIVT